MGIPLLPFQVEVLSDALQHDEDGNFVHKTCGLIIARQNGKSHMMRMRLLFGMYVWGEKWLCIAQNRKLAHEQLDEACKIVENTPWLREQVKRISRVNGDEYIELKNGGKWSIAAATRDGARGFTANLWVDELRDITPAAWKAATPITRAVPNSQIWVTSNAGDAHSTVLNDIRESALRMKDSQLSWYEWSADPSLGIKDKRGWYQANPALGHLIDESDLSLALSMHTPEEFMTESLCRWVDAIESPWPMGAWSACEDKKLELSPDAPTWFGFDVTPSRKRADLVGCQILDDGRIAVGLLQTWKSDTAIDEATIIPDIGQWVKTYRPRVMAFDRWTGSGVAQGLAAVGVPVGDVSGANFVQACDQFLMAMNGKRLAHTSQIDLNLHVNACARKPAADGGWRVVRKHSSNDISAAIAAIMCVYHALAPQQTAVIAFG